MRYFHAVSLFLSIMISEFDSSPVCYLSQHEGAPLAFELELQTNVIANPLFEFIFLA